MELQDQKLRKASKLFLEDFRNNKDKNLDVYLTKVGIEPSFSAACLLCNTINKVTKIKDIYPESDDAEMTLEDYSVKHTGIKEVYSYNLFMFKFELNPTAKGFRINF